MKIKYIMYKVEYYDLAFFSTTTLTQLNVKVGILLAHGKHMYAITASFHLEAQVYTYKTSLTLPLYLKCLFQARKVSSHV